MMLKKRKPAPKASRDSATAILMDTDDMQGLIESGSIEMQVKGKAVQDILNADSSSNKDLRGSVPASRSDMRKTAFMSTTNPNNSYYKFNQRKGKEFEQLQQIYFNFNSTFNKTRTSLSQQQRDYPAIQDDSDGSLGEQPRRLSQGRKHHYLKLKSQKMVDLQKAMAKQDDTMLNTKSHRLLAIDELPSSRSNGETNKSGATLGGGGGGANKNQVSYRVSFVQPFQQRQLQATTGSQNLKSTLGLSKKRESNNSVVSISEQVSKKQLPQIKAQQQQEAYTNSVATVGGSSDLLQESINFNSAGKLPQSSSEIRHHIQITVDGARPPQTSYESKVGKLSLDASHDTLTSINFIKSTGRGAASVIKENSYEETQGTLVNTTQRAGGLNAVEETVHSLHSSEEYNFKQFNELVQQIEQYSQGEPSELYHEQDLTPIHYHHHRQPAQMNQVLMPMETPVIPHHQFRNSAHKLSNSSRQVVMTKINETSSHYDSQQQQQEKQQRNLKDKKGKMKKEQPSRMMQSNINVLSKSTSSKRQYANSIPQRKSVEVSVKNPDGKQTIHVDAYDERLDTSIDTVNIQRGGVEDSLNYGSALPQNLLDYTDTHFDKRTKSTTVKVHNSSSINRSQFRGAKQSVQTTIQTYPLQNDSQAIPGIRETSNSRTQQHSQQTLKAYEKLRQKDQQKQAMKKFLDEDIVWREDGSLSPDRLVVRPHPKASKTKQKQRKDYIDLALVPGGSKMSFSLPKEIVKPVRINRDSLTSCTVYEEQESIDKRGRVLKAKSKTALSDYYSGNGVGKIAGSEQQSLQSSQDLMNPSALSMERDPSQSSIDQLQQQSQNSLSVITMRHRIIGDHQIAKGSVSPIDSILKNLQDKRLRQNVLSSQRHQDGQQAFQQQANQEPKTSALQIKKLSMTNITRNLSHHSSYKKPVLEGTGQRGSKQKLQQLESKQFDVDNNKQKQKRSKQVVPSLDINIAAKRKKKQLEFFASAADFNNAGKRSFNDPAATTHTKMPLFKVKVQKQNRGKLAKNLPASDLAHLTEFDNNGGFQGSKSGQRMPPLQATMKEIKPKWEQLKPQKLLKEPNDASSNLQLGRSDSSTHIDLMKRLEMRPPAATNLNLMSEQKPLEKEEPMTPMLVAIANKIEQQNQRAAAPYETIGHQSSQTRLLESSSMRPLESDQSQICLAQEGGVSVENNFDSLSKLKRIDPQAATISSFNFFMAPAQKQIQKEDGNDRRPSHTSQNFIRYFQIGAGGTQRKF